MLLQSLSPAGLLYRAALSHNPCHPQPCTHWLRNHPALARAQIMDYEYGVCMSAIGHVTPLLGVVSCMQLESLPPRLSPTTAPWPHGPLRCLCFQRSLCNLWLCCPCRALLYMGDVASPKIMHLPQQHLVQPCRAWLAAFCLFQGLVPKTRWAGENSTQAVVWRLYLVHCCWPSLVRMLYLQRVVLFGCTGDQDVSKLSSCVFPLCVLSCSLPEAPCMHASMAVWLFGGCSASGWILVRIAGCVC